MNQAWVWIFISVFSALATDSRAVSSFTDAAVAEATWQRVQQADALLKKNEGARSWELIQQVFRSTGFQALSLDRQRRALSLGARAAYAAGRPLDAQALAVRAAEAPRAGADEWHLRALLSAYASEWADVAAALVRITQQWPDSMQEVDADIVAHAVQELRQQPREAVQLNALLEALFTITWEPADGSATDGLWFHWLQALVEAGDWARARTVVSRIEDPELLIRIRIDNRFRPVIAFDDPALDIEQAARRHVEITARLVRRHPDRLNLLLRHIVALGRAQRVGEALRTIEATLARIERDGSRGQNTFIDQSEQYRWLLDRRSRALLVARRMDDSIAQMRAATAAAREAGDSVSQAINLGFLMLDAGRPAEALAAVAEVDWVNGPSDFGRFQLQSARVVALQALGRDQEAADARRWLDTNRRLSPETYTWVLASLGDLEATEAAMIARLADPVERASALLELQTYPAVHQTRPQLLVAERLRAVAARPNVRAAVEQYGRLESFDVLSPSTW
jgi:hypothetical protein